MLPIYMKDRATSSPSSFDGTTLRDLEANVVFAMGHKFSPLLRRAASDGSMDFIIPEFSQHDGRPPLEDHVADGRTADEDHHPITPDQAADVVDAVLEDCWMASPVPELPREQERPAKNPRPSFSSNNKKALLDPTSESRPASTSCTLPTADDPMDESFVASLYAPGEEGRINPSHAIIRRDVLEVRQTRSGRVFFRCKCCAHRPRSERSRQSVLAPQSVGGLYRAVVRFMMYHVPACHDIPREIKELSPKATKTVQPRGTKGYWVESAKRMGLRDAEGGRGVIIVPSKGEAEE